MAAVFVNKEAHGSLAQLQPRRFRDHSALYKLVPSEPNATLCAHQQQRNEPRDQQRSVAQVSVRFTRPRFTRDSRNFNTVF